MKSINVKYDIKATIIWQRSYQYAIFIVSRPAYSIPMRQYFASCADEKLAGTVWRDDENDYPMRERCPLPSSSDTLLSQWQAVLETRPPADEIAPARRA